MFTIRLSVVLHLCLLYLATSTRRVKRVVRGTTIGCVLHLPGHLVLVKKTIDIEGEQIRVSSLLNTTTLNHLCGAIILSPNYALTAAHCVHFSADQYALQMNNYCVEDEPVYPRAEILEIIVNDGYDAETRAHDIALLRIAVRMDDVIWLNDTVLPASSFGVSGDCILYGYGYRDPNLIEISNNLLAGKVKIVSLDECTEKLGSYVAPKYDSGMMCAVGDEVDSCQGDSGSPLICDDYLQGICSYGMSCGVPGLPGVYTSIGAHLKWIHNVMNQI